MSPSTTPAPASRRQLGAYFGLLWLTLGFAEPTGMVSLPVIFWLKDGLGLEPGKLALFEALIAAPIYFGFLFGFLRDRWKPFGGADRQFLLLAAPLGIASYCWLATGTLSSSRLLVGVLVAALAFECLETTAEALMTSAAQRHVMSGRLSAFSEVVEMMPSMVSMLAGGWIAGHLRPQTSFTIAAAVTGLVMLLALWRPVSVFQRPEVAPVEERPSQALRRLVGDRALWPVMGALLLWNFSPGWSTPLVYFLTDGVGISTTAFGAARAAAFAGGALAAVMYVLMCRRYAIRRIMWWTFLINVPAVFLLLAANGGGQAVAVSGTIGLLTGMGNIALFDLLRRACPSKLEGTGTMLGCSVFAIGGTVGDLAGAWMYQTSGFAICLAADAIATAAIFPLLARVPESVLSSRDGEEPAPAPLPKAA